MVLNAACLLPGSPTSRTLKGLHACSLYGNEIPESRNEGPTKRNREETAFVVHLQCIQHCLECFHVYHLIQNHCSSIESLCLVRHSLKNFMCIQTLNSQSETVKEVLLYIKELR